MMNFVQELEQLSTSIKSKVDTVVQRELIDPVDTFLKHYVQSSSDLLKSCEATWNKLHLERTNMILNKENYFNQSFQLHQLKKQVQKEP